jgi:hypothetical protein
MTIEITSPDVEVLIRQPMKSGAFKSPEASFGQHCVHTRWTAEPVRI